MSKDQLISNRHFLPGCMALFTTLAAAPASAGAADTCPMSADEIAMPGASQEPSNWIFTPVSVSPAVPSITTSALGIRSVFDGLIGGSLENS
jgi:hypothetical protein